MVGWVLLGRMNFLSIGRLVLNFLVSVLSWLICIFLMIFMLGR